MIVKHICKLEADALHILFRCVDSDTEDPVPLTMKTGRKKAVIVVDDSGMKLNIATTVGEIIIAWCLMTGIKKL